MSRQISKLVLASQSPQRLNLLCQLIPQTKIITRPADIDEARFHELGPRLRCGKLARLKAVAALDAYGIDPEVSLFLGADTEVILGGVELGKPRSEQEAREMLEHLRGDSHDVITAVSLYCTLTQRWIDAVEVSTVEFKNFSEGILHAYLQTQEWLGRSGGYALQGMGVLLTEGISGSYSNIVGLPLEKLGDMIFSELNYSVA